MDYDEYSEDKENRGWAFNKACDVATAGEDPRETIERARIFHEYLNEMNSTKDNVSELRVVSDEKATRD